MKQFDKLTIILPSEARMEKNEEFGLLSRWKKCFQEYAKYFHEIEVYTCDSKDYTNKLGIKHIKVPFLIDLPYIRPLIYNLWLVLKAKSMKGDILRFFGSVYPFIGLIKFFSKKPVVISYQYDFYGKTKSDFGWLRGIISYFVEKFSVTNANLVIVTTNELSNILKKRYNIKSVIIPNFVDTELFYPDDEEEKNYIFYAGRIFWHKGIGYLLEAFRDIEKKYPEIELWIAGKGADEEYKIKAKQLGIKKVKFLGALYQVKIAFLMRKCLIFVLPTVTREGHPKALIEALVSGAACVATDVEGNREVIRNMENGILVPPRSSQALFEAFDRLIKDKILRNKLKMNARKEKEKYDLKNIVKKEIEILQEVVSKWK
jgi:glycosyltransferase involved in cell wall biosynthesis